MQIGLDAGNWSLAAEALGVALSVNGPPPETVADDDEGQSE
jgi:hypothetical protein